MMQEGNESVTRPRRRVVPSDCDGDYSSSVAKLDCPECGGNLFLMARRQNKPSWRCCTRPTHVFVMEADRVLVPVAAPDRKSVV